MSTLLASLAGLAIAGCMGTAGGGDADASARDRRVRAFIEQARAATERYRDRATAIADGYHLIGEDFPGMGEHWVNAGLLFGGKHDVEHPEFLTYVDLGGAPRLLGVAYGLPLLEGEEPPEWPTGREAWHAHSRSLDDETLLPRHHASDHWSQGPRLAMLHAWIWLENPEGLFAPDNWAIPFLRLGLASPTKGGTDAGKALSLLSGAGDYLARAVPLAVAPTAIDTPTLRAAVARARANAQAVAGTRSDPVLSAAELAELGAAWREMWRMIDAALPADATERLRFLAFR